MSDQEYYQACCDARSERMRVLVASARITALAYDEVVPIFVTVESENHGCGGQYWTRRASGSYNPGGTQPYRQVASVLPWQLSDPRRASLDGEAGRRPWGCAER